MRHFKGLLAFGNVEVRSLPHQPAIPVFREFSSLDMKRPAKCGLFSLLTVSGDRRSNFLAREFPKVSSRTREYSRFLETGPGDERTKLLPGEAAVDGGETTEGRSHSEIF